MTTTHGYEVKVSADAASGQIRQVVEFIAPPDIRETVISQVLFTLDEQVRKSLIELGWTPPGAGAAPADLKYYEAMMADHRRLVRELDVAWNGEAGAAQQASLCDVVSQVRRELPALRAAKDDPIPGIALRKLSEAFDSLIGVCSSGPDGAPRAPTRQELARARAYLPPYCRNAFRKGPK